MNNKAQLVDEESMSGGEEEHLLAMRMMGKKITS
jgi:hypothetical protein